MRASCAGAGLRIALIRAEGELSLYNGEGGTLIESIAIPGQSSKGFAIAEGEDSVHFGRGQVVYDASAARLGVAVSGQEAPLSVMQALDREGDGRPDWLGVDPLGVEGVADIGVWRAGTSALTWASQGFVDSAVEGRDWLVLYLAKH